jgi:hypothetical protein
MAIIELLLENIWIIFVILGFFASLFSKSGQQGKGAERNGRPGPRPGQGPRPPRPQSGMPPFGMPPFGGDFSFPAKREAETAADHAGKTGAVLPEAARSSQHAAAEARPDHSRLPQDVRAASPVSQPADSGQIRQNRGKKRIPCTPHASRAVEGMMWAEVFGPPRAKKPYNPYSHIRRGNKE